MKYTANDFRPMQYKLSINDGPLYTFTGTKIDVIAEARRLAKVSGCDVDIYDEYDHIVTVIRPPSDHNKEQS